MTIQRTNVRFPSNGMALAGHVYLPENASGGRLPAIVVGHPTTGVKEQTSAIYAARLAEAGFLALTFDAAYQGDSEGLPRGLENPVQRADDFRNAVTYLSTRADVDSERIGVMGVCGSGAYAPYAAQTDHRIKAVAGVSGTDATCFFRDGNPEAWRAQVAASGAARTEEAQGRPVRMVPVLPESVDESTPAAVAEFFDYYRTPRAQHPNSVGAYALRSADLLDQFDAFADVAKIAPRPLLMIAGTEAVTRGFSEKAIADIGESGELALIEGATHVDLYDRDPYVAQAVEKLTAFFTAHLRG
ncbi:alpha/beta hydrolase [Micromonospora sp. WMMD1082]|uniref:alpha/beta hydrolase n=1 Tax=Micromonospora sp. WMMD1082 TaxID=3016104 RepID=UPI0024168F52|nr:alpha/beta hydrolase [Micromonospora sp. WMMD1082]MDG4797685.1 alpha/beta hydrolase [Micromonospora sp. WMMD1082]